MRRTLFILVNVLWSEFDFARPFSLGNSEQDDWELITWSSRFPVANCSITWTCLSVPEVVNSGPNTILSSKGEGVQRSGLLDKESGSKLVAPFINWMVKLKQSKNWTHLVCLGLYFCLVLKKVRLLLSDLISTGILVLWQWCLQCVKPPITAYSSLSWTGYLNSVSLNFPE